MLAGCEVDERHHSLGTRGRKATTGPAAEKAFMCLRRNGGKSPETENSDDF